MQTIRQIYHINAPVEKVWNALTDPQAIAAWSGEPATMDDKVGTNFTLWGGDIYGTNKEVVPNQKLVQDWFGGLWDQPSIVTFTLIPVGTTTDVELINENVPEKDVEDIDYGWKEFYMSPLKEFVERV